MRILLSDLRYGHEHPGLDLNSRKTGRETISPTRLASIKAKGILKPFLVVFRDEPQGEDQPTARVPYVVDGNKRLFHCRHLETAGELPADLVEFGVECTERFDSDQEALETSIMANIEFEPVHEVDQFESFAALEEAGETRTAIASRFGISAMTVRRRLALGSLAPEIREAWRGGKISTEVAQAFTVVGDLALQASTLEGLVKAHGTSFYPHTVRAALGVREKVGALLYVGEDAYKAAGGRLSTDLFDSKTYVLDEPVLASLTRAKVEEIAQTLVAGEGWKWAAFREDLGNDFYQWESIEPELIFTEEQAARLTELDRLVAEEGLENYKADDERRSIRRVARDVSITAEEKARSGVVISIMHDGTVSLDLGKIKPEDVVAKEAAAAEPVVEEEGPGAEPKAATEMLWITETHALADVIKGDWNLALELVCATLLVNDGKQALRLKSAGSSTLSDVREDLTTEFCARDDEQTVFAAALGHVRVLNENGIRSLFCRLVAGAVGTTAEQRAGHAWNANVTQLGVDELRDAAYGPALLKAVRVRFDPESYFTAAKKGHALLCLADCFGEDYAKKWAGKKKDAVASLASGAAASRGWLPPYLRVEGYEISAAEPASAEGEG